MFIYYSLVIIDNVLSVKRNIVITKKEWKMDGFSCWEQKQNINKDQWSKLASGNSVSVVSETLKYRSASWSISRHENMDLFWLFKKLLLSFVLTQRPGRLIVCKEIFLLVIVVFQIYWN